MKKFACYASRLACPAMLAIHLSSVAHAQPVLNDPNLTTVTAASGLTQPVNLTFLGTDDMLVLEKASGQVKRVVSGVVTGVALDLAVNSASERGLLGVAKHPNFPATPYIYLFWSESTTGADSTNASEAPLMGNRVDRFLWNGSTLTLDQNILRLRSFQLDAGQPARGNHDGGMIRFGPDGKLYVMVGDTGRRGFTQNNLTGPFPDDQFGGPEPDDAHTTGVIFRLNDDGTAPSDNPFFNVTNFANMNKVFGYGVRNGFGLSFDPETGRLWNQEHGDDTFDEINIVRPGYNGGWVQFMGPVSRISQFREIEIARAGGLQQLRWPPTNIATHPIIGFKRLWRLKTSVYTDPVFSWKFAVAPGTIHFVNTASLGKGYENSMLVSASRTTMLQGYLMKLDLNSARNGFIFSDPRLADGVADNLDKFEPTESESLLLGSNFGVVTAMETSPDGRVFLVSLDRGLIYELKRL